MSTRLLIPDAPAAGPATPITDLAAQWQHFCAAHQVRHVLLAVPEDDAVIAALCAQPAWVVEHADQTIVILCPGDEPPQDWREAPATAPAWICGAGQSVVQAHGVRE